MPNTATPTPTPTPAPAASCPPSSTGTNSVTFSVTLNEQTGGQPPEKEWHMVCNGTDYAPGHYPTMSVPFGDTAAFTYTITSGANFPANGPGNKINAIGIVGGTAKPPQAGNGSGLITVSAPTGTTLSFTDSNSTKPANSLNYLLYFNDGTKLDPIIDNGGCCKPAPVGGGFFQSATFLIALAILAVLIIAYVAYRVRGAKRTDP